MTLRTNHHLLLGCRRAGRRRLVLSRQVLAPLCQVLVSFRRPLALVLLVWAPIVLVGLTSCSDPATLSHDFRSLPLRGWPRADTLTYPSLLPDSAASYRLAVDVRHEGHYPYSELRLRLLTASTASDTLCLHLADDRGRWMGHGLGGLYQCRIEAGTFRADSAGLYTFRIVHAMPDSLLRGVSDVGLLIQRLP